MLVGLLIFVAGAAQGEDGASLAVTGLAILAGGFLGLLLAALWQVWLDRHDIARTIRSWLR
jgi:hypothetical protein